MLNTRTLKNDTETTVSRGQAPQKGENKDLNSG